MNLKFLICIFGLVCFSACEKNSRCHDSDCYEQALESFKKQPNAVKIEEYTLRHERVFYLDDGATYSDGVSYYIDTQCDTVCYMVGEGINPPCFAQLIFIREVWKK